VFFENTTNHIFVDLGTEGECNDVGDACATESGIPALDLRLTITAVIKRLCAEMNNEK